MNSLKSRFQKEDLKCHVCGNTKPLLECFGGPAFLCLGCLQSLSSKKGKPMDAFIISDPDTGTVTGCGLCLDGEWIQTSHPTRKQDETRDSIKNRK